MATQNVENGGVFITSKLAQCSGPIDGRVTTPTAVASCELRSWMDFNFDLIPQGSVIKSARLYLQPHRNSSPDHVGPLIANHGQNDPHILLDPALIGYGGFLVGSLDANWPLLENDPTWNTLYNHRGDVEIFAPAADAVWNPISLYQTVSESGFNLEAKQLVQKLLDGKYTNGFSTAISIRNALQSGNNSSYCFYPTVATMYPPRLVCLQVQISLLLDP